MKDGPSFLGVLTGTSSAHSLNSNDGEQPACGPHDMTFISRVLNSFLYPEARGGKR